MPRPSALTVVSLPGARWKQLNGDRDDARLWRDAAFQAQAEAFWRELAEHLRGHPAIVAWNPLNEPRYERHHDNPLWRVLVGPRP